MSVRVVMDLGTFTFHRTVPMVPPTDASSSSRAECLLHLMVASDTMGPESARENGVLLRAFEDSTCAMIFPSIKICDRLPPSPFGSTIAVEEISSYNANFTTNLGGNALGLLGPSCTTSSAGDFVVVRLLFELLDALDVLDIFDAMVLALLKSSSNEASNGSNGLAICDSVQWLELLNKIIQGCRGLGYRKRYYDRALADVHFLLRRYACCRATRLRRCCLFCPSSRHGRDHGSASYAIIVLCPFCIRLWSPQRHCHWL